MVATSARSAKGSSGNGYFLFPRPFPMDVEPLYCAEQIKVPAELPEIMKQWAKEVIRANPANINEFSAKCVPACCCAS